jgi:hypothetical protein
MNDADHDRVDAWLRGVQDANGNGFPAALIDDFRGFSTVVQRYALNTLGILDPTARQAFEAAANGQHPSTDDDADDIDDLHEIDWPSYWDDDDGDDERWLLEPVWAVGRGHVLYGPAKSGKSYVALYFALCVATGRTLDGRTVAPQHVVYADFEMTRDDLRDRLDAFGIGSDADLSYLHYLSLPTIEGLDTKEGGSVLVERCVSVGARVVIIDTTGRAMIGAENDADTIRAFYRNTGQQLKRDNVAYVRLDHTGKDAERGQRGTSAKADDVDVVVRLDRRDDGVRLTTTHRRMNWVPQTVDLTEHRADDGTIAYRLATGRSWPAGTKECADDLDRLEVPLETSRRAAGRILTAAGCGKRDEVVRAAVTHRRERCEGLK